MSHSNPINIPGRKLASGVPPQNNNPPNMFSPPPSCASSFDMYCGHLESAARFRDQWTKHVSSFKDSSFVKAYKLDGSTNLKPCTKENHKNVPK